MLEVANRGLPQRNWLRFLSILVEADYNYHENAACYFHAC